MVIGGGWEFNPKGRFGPQVFAMQQVGALGNLCDRRPGFRRHRQLPGRSERPRYPLTLLRAQRLDRIQSNGAQGGNHAREELRN